jgi:hypothetical protein
MEWMRMFNGTKGKLTVYVCVVNFNNKFKMNLTSSKKSLLVMKLAFTGEIWIQNYSHQNGNVHSCHFQRRPDQNDQVSRACQFFLTMMELCNTYFSPQAELSSSSITQVCYGVYGKMFAKNVLENYELETS